MKNANECSYELILRKNMVKILFLTMFLIAFSVFVYGDTYAASVTPAKASDGIIVVYKDGTSVKTIEKQLSANDSSTERISRIDSDTRYAVADVPEDQTVSETIKDYEKNSNVDYAQPNYLYKAYTNDTYYSSLWHLNTVKAVSAASYYSSLGATSKVKVAVLDTGVAVSHNDLSTCFDSSLSVDITSSDSGDYSKLSGDSVGHGTHVTGIIGATAGNGLGVAGVGSTITGNNMDVFVENVFRYYNADPSNDIDEAGYYSDTTDIINGLYYAIKNGAKVINMSLGYVSSPGSSCNSALATALDSCESNGITVVCAGGNDGNDEYARYPNYPADYDTCISVTATDATNDHAYYSSYNSYKDIAAPGTRLLSTYNEFNSDYDGYYVMMSGTSMASPVVAGIVASMYSVNPSLTPSEIRSILYDTATDLGTSGRDDYYGYGLVNAYAALKEAVSETTESTTETGADTNDILTITFDSNGGATPSFSSSSVTSGGTVSTLPTATRSKYTFAGWYTEASGGTKVTTSTVIESSMTLYAHWTKVTVARDSLYSLKSKYSKIYAVAKSVSKAKGYQIRYSRSSRFTSSKYKTSSTIKITTGKLTKNRYYYVKVRAYKLDSNGTRIYGSWSTYKKVRVR